MIKKAILVLENGEIFSGNGWIFQDRSCGEIVFNTSFTGYQEIISDPSYAGQMITFTFPLVGNIGTNIEDNESFKIHTKGIITREISDEFSNWRGQNSLKEYLIKNKISFISGVDTRKLTKIIRQKGVVYGSMQYDEIFSIEETMNYIHQHKQNAELDYVKKVSCRESYSITNNYNEKLHIIVIDYGVKAGILNSLKKLNCIITVVNAEITAEEIMKIQPDGVVLSNGPGDPAVCDYAIQTIKKIIKMQLPILGICLGMQLLAISFKCKSYKMKFGHHGANHPVLDVESNKVIISSQNHNFAISEDQFSNELIVTHRSLFDNSIQGIKHKIMPLYGYQGHPEASPGPNDWQYIFDNFINSAKEYFLHTKKQVEYICQKETT